MKLVYHFQCMTGRLTNEKYEGRNFDAFLDSSDSGLERAIDQI